MKTVGHEYYISLEIAKLLEEAGFNWECRGNCVGDDVFTDGICGPNVMNNSEFSVLRVPALDVAQRWLREVKNYYVSVDVDCDSIGVFYTVRYIFHDGDKYNASYIWEDTEMNIVKHRRIFENYEEALEAGIKKVLEIILEK